MNGDIIVVRVPKGEIDQHMQGKIRQWNDKRGFGFIESQDLDDKIFFHISSIQDRGHRPRIDEIVEFVVAKDNNDRVKADKICIAGLPRNNYNRTVNPYIKVVPAMLTHFDYLLILIGLCSIGYVAMDAVQSGNVLNAWPYAIPAVVAHFLFYRPRKPKQTHFTCSRCKTASQFDLRTIKAWKRGMVRFFCERCHAHWRSNKAEDLDTMAHARGKQRNLRYSFVISLLFILAAVIYLRFG